MVTSRHRFLPCMSSQCKSQVLGRCRNHLMSSCRIIPFTLAELRKAKPVKFVGVPINSFISMSGAGWHGDKCACGNSYAIGKCEWAQSETAHDNCGKVRRAHQRFVLGPLEKESNERRVKPSTRWLSRKKLSILCILSIAAFVQPSSATTASTSWRRGSIYSGLERRRYNAWVIVYRYAIVRTALSGGEISALSLAWEVEWIAAKLTTSNRLATPSTDLSTPLASLMSHMSISFCDSTIQ